MKVIYDSQIFAEQEYGGISRYVCALASQVSALPDLEVKVVAPLHVNRYLKGLDKNLVVGCYVPRLPKTARLLRSLSAALSVPLAGLMHTDIVHETYYSERSPWSARVPHVLTIYDMIEERFPESFVTGYPLARRKRCATARADHVFCISENTRRDLLEVHGLPHDRVSVTYLGYDQLPSSNLKVHDLVGPAPFILHVAGRHGYKNFEGLIRAYAASAWLKGSLRIVCFGGGPFSAAEQALMAALGLTDRQVLQIGGDDARLAALYRAAAALVYPSKYEGFGIPPLEAMSMECPVICSNTSSIPEVVGDAGEYFDPFDIESIKTSIERVLQSSQRRTELISLGQSRCMLFSWERCAHETLDVYRRLAR